LHNSDKACLIALYMNGWGKHYSWTDDNEPRTAKQTGLWKLLLLFRYEESWGWCPK